MKHALAEERGTEMDAIKSTHERAIRPAFDSVDPANIKELAIKPSDPRVDPCLLTALTFGGTTLDNGVKILVDSDFESIRANRLGEARRYNEAVKRKNASLLRIDPKQILILRAFRHRKEPDGICAKQDFGCNFERVPGTAHPKRLSFAPGSVKRKYLDWPRWPAAGLTKARSGLLSETANNRKEIPDDGIDNQ
jgi:hypothetical protein